MTVDADARDAEDAICTTLRCYEGLRLVWDRFCDLLATGQDTASARKSFLSALAAFDEWLQAASRVDAFVEAVTTRSGREFEARHTFQEAIEKVRTVRQSAADALAYINEPRPSVAPGVLAEAETLFAQGKFKDLGTLQRFS